MSKQRSSWKCTSAACYGLDARDNDPPSDMLRLLYVPGDTGGPGGPKCSAPWKFEYLSRRILVLLGLALSHGLLRYPEGAVAKGCRTDTSTVPPGPSRSDEAPPLLAKD